MSLNAKKPKRTRASLPDVPLPPVLVDIAMQKMLHNNQDYKAAIEKNAQSYEDRLVPVFNDGYNRGHKAGWKEAASANQEYDFKSSYVTAAKDLISGDNFILIDKNNLANTIKGKTTQKLIGEIPAGDNRYAGLQNDVFRDQRMGTLTDIYARDSSWISAQDEILFLDIAKTRKYAQKRGRIDGKKIFTNQSGNLD
jgi:hypothetical protein